MRSLRGAEWSASALAVALAAACATEAPSNQSPARAALSAEAPSAPGQGAPAAYRSPSLGRGYSARDRHMADCLASFPGYDPATDRIVRAGISEPCPL